jgi:hypothetical protein
MDMREEIVRYLVWKDDEGGVCSFLYGKGVENFPEPLRDLAAQLEAAMDALAAKTQELCDQHGIDSSNPWAEFQKYEELDLQRYKELLQREDQ